jgi:hypothetical protein
MLGIWDSLGRLLTHSESCVSLGRDRRLESHMDVGSGACFAMDWTCSPTS